MKKFTLILAFIGMITLQSCYTEEVVVQDDYDNDTISEVFEYSNVDFTNSNNYKVILDFPYTIYASDMVLVYRLSNYNSANGDYWKLLPETYYFDDGTLDFGYRNDATRYDSEVSLYGYDLPALNAQYRLNQVLRVVVIPAALGNKGTANVDFNDYQAVINHYGIDDKNITKINKK
ncbi:conserved hypothetical protein [Flavobacterium sp. 9AF]|uniref:hypothetical protein n=1 Tax=Flavobacterium sp. 9AF TaxID=2653142 RepID=UPI0012F2821D|nr:hypothetical protein [Flavobacterium sp. 9AF]VXC16808.1 conserved hypothetical protein [Flavobacterium sp. 9AF]